MAAGSVNNIHKQQEGVIALLGTHADGAMGNSLKRLTHTGLCGMIPSPAISFEVSTMIVVSRSARSAAAARMIVVFPEPGSPSTSTDCLVPSRVSTIMSALLVKERPILMVKPAVLPSRLMIALIRCSVPSIPARWSEPKSPTCSKRCAKHLESS
eukprot:6189288-Pleurochrysis_carterae.AAC.2